MRFLRRTRGRDDRFARHLSVTAVAQGVTLGFGALSGVLAARLLGPVGRGEVAALTIWPTALVSLAAMGLNQAIVFHTGRRSFTLSEVWTASTVIGLAQSALVLVVGIALIPFVLRHYPAHVRHLALLFLGVCPFIVLGGYPGSLLQGKMDLLSFNLILAAPPFTYALGLALLVVFHRPYLGEAVTSRALSYVFGFMFAYWLLLRSQRVRFAWNGQGCSGLLLFGWKTQLGNISAYVNRWLDQLILSIFVPPRDLGLYAVAVTVALAVCLVPQAAGAVTLAAGSNAMPEAARGVIARAYRTSLLWLLIVCTFLYVSALSLIVRVFGPQFAGAAGACRILLPGMVALGLTQVLYDGVRALGHPEIPSYGEGFATLVTLVALYLLLPRTGFVGAAIASSLAYGSSHILALILCSSRLRIGIRDLLRAPFKAEGPLHVRGEGVDRLECGIGEN